jgi:PAS domain-containing protein
VGCPITHFQTPESIELTIGSLRHLLAEGEVLDTPRRFVRRDGNVLDVLASGRVEREHGEIRILGALVDITARLRAEAALRESEQRARLALAAVNSSGSWDWDTAKDVIYADASFAQVFGIDPAHAAVGASLGDILVNAPASDRAKVLQEYEQAMRVSGDHSFVHPVMQPNGLVRWFLAQCHCSLTLDGAPLPARRTDRHHRPAKP